jgi:uncharacterized protein (TIGR04141 family)
VKKFEDALDDEKENKAYPLIPDFGLTGTLFVGRQNQSTPDWVALLTPYLQMPVEGAFSANISAVLMVTYEKRIFALTFGYGKNLLIDSSWVRDFGLKVTLNRVDPAKLRSIDSKTYEDLVRSTRTQTSRSSKVDSFQLDVARDLVRGVTGDSSDTTFFKRLTGADALKFSTTVPFADLGDLLDELLAAYEDDTYKQHFGWIDNIKEADPIVAFQLDGRLIDALHASDVDGMHLAPADVVEWGNIAGFNFTRGDTGAHYLELELERYLEVLGEKLPELTLEQLRRHKVRVLYDGSDELRDMWSVYDCLVWETVIKAKRYVLFDGRWFEIAEDYAAGVKKFVGALAADPIALPEAKSGDDEDIYNASVEQADPKRFALLDRQTVRPSNAASPIEFCDLLSAEGHIVHVKKRSSSATLSHLFSQASVSCDIFLQDASVRKDVASKLRKMKKPAHAKLITKVKPLPSEFHVIYAVLAKEGEVWPPELPFFSAVNLVHHASRIQNLGFKVTLQHVKQIK